jgi:hypothetical protein
MADTKDRAREYLAEHSYYSEVFGQTFIAVDTLTAMVEFAEQETKELKEQIEKMKCCANCKHSRTEYEHCRTDKHEKWEIKEND